MRLLKTAVLILLFSVNAAAQNADRDFMKPMWVSDFHEADIVALIQVKSCKILDTMGSTTAQQVSGEVLQMFKNSKPKSNPVKAISYFGTVAIKMQWLKEDMTIGVFLKAHQHKDSTYFYWMENSGFAADDTDYIRSLTNEDSLYNHLADNYNSYDEKPLWLRAKLNSAAAKTASITVTESITKTSAFGPGKTYTVPVDEIIADAPLLNAVAGKIYYFPLVKRGDGNYHITLPILPRLSAYKVRELKAR